MRPPDLADTLTALALGACPPEADGGPDRLQVEAVEISLPLIVRLERGPDGPRFLAQPPWTAFRAGFEPVAHRARLSLAPVAVPAAAAPHPSSDPARPASADAVLQPPGRPDSAG